jgi:uncharacterized repeat protein (TIGR03803 family)
MQCTKPWVFLVAVFAMFFGFLNIANPVLAASKEKVLHSFNGPRGGAPSGGVVFDAAGNLYGMTALGGGTGCNFEGCGVVFQLTRGKNGEWAEKVLHWFDPIGGDGATPCGSLIFDASGNLYGMTFQGGSYNEGTAFEITPSPNGKWTEKVLHRFRGDKGGIYPRAGLVLDADGNLYGTTTGDGAPLQRLGGVVFELTPGAGGKWTETVLHSFCPDSKCADGSAPFANLIFDAAGNLYGTTSGGGPQGEGTVFRLVHNPDGTWTETVLYSFQRNGVDGAQPLAGLIFDGAGNLYGTTAYGGSGGGGCGGFGCGTAFQLSPGSNGQWSETVLYNFCTLTRCTDGSAPIAGMAFDEAGNLYGTTSYGGTGGDCGQFGCGTVFQLTPGANGKWKETVLYSFCSVGNDCKDGASPTGDMIFDMSGNLYGTTVGGGADGGGSVFEIAP